MGTAKCSPARFAGRVAAVATLMAAISRTAAAAVQFTFSFSTVWSPPAMTVQPPAEERAPIIAAPVVPGPIIANPPTSPSSDPFPNAHSFPTSLSAASGPEWWNLSQSASVPATPASTAADVAAVVSGNNQFAYDLYGTLSQTNTGNVVFSPYSISTALAMTYAGAAGQTAAEMAQTLHFTLPESQLAPAMGQLISETNNQGGANYQLSVANHLWAQTGFAFQSSFLNTLSTDYQAPLSQLDFVNNTEASRQTINTWTANQTNQKIQNLFPQGSIAPNTRLVLTNAVYFKGQWQDAFNPGLTQPENFYLSSGSLESVPMMHQEGTFKYAAFQNFSMLDLPYQGGDISMVAILPSQSSSLASAEQSLNAQTLTQDESQLTNTLVQVGLPKFTMTSQFNLGGTLAGMGMPSAFGTGANFSGMDGNRDLYISSVIHKAYISVDEQGTEAAGATGVVIGIMASAVPPPPQATFDADRPFDFVLRDDKTGSILFMGRVSDPGGTPIVTPLPTDTFFSSPGSAIGATHSAFTPALSGTSSSFSSDFGGTWDPFLAGEDSGISSDDGSGGTTVSPGLLDWNGPDQPDIDVDSAPADPLDFSSPSDDGSSGSPLDVSSVPEPSTWVLLVAGIVALAIRTTASQSP
jgi:serpin B